MLTSSLTRSRYLKYSATACKTVRPMLRDRGLFCLSCLSVCNVVVLWPNGWMNQDATWYEGKSRPRRHCVRWGLSPLTFRPMSIMAKRSPILATAELLFFLVFFIILSVSLSQRKCIYFSPSSAFLTCLSHLVSFIDTKWVPGVIAAQPSPFLQIDVIEAMVIVRRARRKLSGLFCAVLCAIIVHSAVHIHMNRPNRSLDWVLSHWAHFTVLIFIFVYVCMHFLYDCILHACVIL